jgi:hypothetical protein
MNTATNTIDFVDAAPRLAASSNYCVALRVQTTQDQPDDDVSILAETCRVEVGDPLAACRELLGTELAGSPALERVLAELPAVGVLSGREPLVLERLLVGPDGLGVHLEATVLPVSDWQADELLEWLTDPSEPELGPELAALRSDELAAAWRAEHDRPMSVLFLDKRTGQPAVSPCA